VSVSAAPPPLIDNPPSASQREYLRSGLPTLYRDPDSFAMRFVGALEEVLDPIVALLDNLDAHLDPALAPPLVLDSLGAWLGLDIGDMVELRDRRELVACAIELAPEFVDDEGNLGRGAKGGVIRQRGTKAGLELALRRSFPRWGLTVHDDGVAWVSTDPDRPAKPSPRTFTVRWSTPLDVHQRQAVDRVVHDMRPVGASYTLDGPFAERAAGRPA
jgi:hypothetical protein